jgi:hypothetical protein
VSVLNDRVELISRTNSEIADWLLVGASPQRNPLHLAHSLLGTTKG